MTHTDALEAAARQLYGMHGENTKPWACLGDAAKALWIVEAEKITEAFQQAQAAASLLGEAAEMVASLKHEAQIADVSCDGVSRQDGTAYRAAIAFIESQAAALALKDAEIADLKDSAEISAIEIRRLNKAILDQKSIEGSCNEYERQQRLCHLLLSGRIGDEETDGLSQRLRNYMEQRDALPTAVPPQPAEETPRCQCGAMSRQECNDLPSMRHCDGAVAMHENDPAQGAERKETPHG